MYFVSSISSPTMRTPSTAARRKSAALPNSRCCTQNSLQEQSIFLVALQQPRFERTFKEQVYASTQHKPHDREQFRGRQSWIYLFDSEICQPKDGNASGYERAQERQNSRFIGRI